MVADLITGSRPALSGWFLWVPACAAGCCRLGDGDVVDLHRPVTAGRWDRAPCARSAFTSATLRIVALSENGVAAIQAGIGNFRDEELRAVGVGTGVGVGQTARTIKL